jgi:RNA polymerase sigma factor (sigma-70 family)
MDLDVAELCRAHYDEIARFVKRHRIDPATADDIVQQTFEEALRCRATYDPARATPRAWLFGIAVNLKGHYFRHRRATDKAYRLAATRLDPPGDDWVRELIDRLDARARRDAIDTALDALSKSQLDVLTLYAWTELTQREIAAALEIPEGTVKSRLNSARKHVRAILQASLLEQSDG